MFEQFESPESPRPTLTLKSVARFTAFFALGIFASQLVRVVPELRPLFWIVAVAGLGWLAYAIRRTQDLALVTVVAIVLSALFAGHWDGLFHNTAQGLANLQEVAQ